MISVLNPEIKHLSLPSEANSLLSLESWINSICDGYKISVELYGNILIALSEAVNNAIIHGNKNQKERKAHVVSKIEKEKIVFTVSDEGKGFDFTQLPDPTLPENIEKPQGRGIFLMKHLSDGVVFEEPGNKVEITFNT